MAWRGLHLSQPARLSLDRGALAVERDGQPPLRFALEDLAYAVLDSPQITLTARLLAACAQAGLAIISCDEKHMPCGLHLSFMGHFRQTDVLQRQLALSRPAAKRLWRQMVREKILNQGRCLDVWKRPDGATLAAMADQVQPGDPDNIEARAARLYWSRLFDDFVRQDESDARNALLNYGYAVVRAGWARALVAYGFLPSLGMHHDSQGNAFNLTDDLIEATRPAVDHRAMTLASMAGFDRARPLTLDDRRHMSAVLTDRVRLGSQTLTLLDAIEQAVISLKRVLMDEAGSALLLPVPLFDPPQAVPA